MLAPRIYGAAGKRARVTPLPRALFLCFASKNISTAGLLPLCAQLAGLEHSWQGLECGEGPFCPAVCGVSGEGRWLCLLRHSLKSGHAGVNSSCPSWLSPRSPQPARRFRLRFCCRKAASRRPALPEELPQPGGSWQRCLAGHRALLAPRWQGGIVGQRLANPGVATDLWACLRGVECGLELLLDPSDVVSSALPSCAPRRAVTLGRCWGAVAELPRMPWALC